MRIGDVGFVQPFRYTFIIWAAIFDVALFDAWPDARSLTGALVVVVCGIGSLSQEGRRQTSGDAAYGVRLSEREDEAMQAPEPGDMLPAAGALEVRAATPLEEIGNDVSS